MNPPVVCLAHGSRHPEADRTVVDIARAVAGLTGHETRAAYLDFSPLTPTTVARLLAAEGHTEAVVVPLLFTTAFHMTTDVPDALAAATEETGVVLHRADGIGTGDDLAGVLASRVAPGADHLVLYSVGSSVPGANERVAELAGDVGRRLGVPARALTATGGPGTGRDALVAHVRDVVRQGAGRVAVEPLFISPGTLWDTAVRALAGSPVAAAVTAGAPLGTAVAPLVAARLTARPAAHRPHTPGGNGGTTR
ncbi:CbiX/SirB N-terminal domain-containing protein [Corynebacterium sp.]|uniref:sirohydrochlorin chelatase n=1 Tax=Corynebacterium sp. TaxID=1720 RepID=UPI0025C4B2C0|nr:CbiX/SirB N-terminal domain-containing protein [Corynebacterium sp.]